MYHKKSYTKHKNSKNKIGLFEIIQVVIYHNNWYTNDHDQSSVEENGGKGENNHVTHTYMWNSKRWWNEKYIFSARLIQEPYNIW